MCVCVSLCWRAHMFVCMHMCLLLGGQVLTCKCVFGVFSFLPGAMCGHSTHSSFTPQTSSRRSNYTDTDMRAPPLMAAYVHGSTS